MIFETPTSRVVHAQPASATDWPAQPSTGQPDPVPGDSPSETQLGRVVVVTGGGSGIGRAVANRFAALGANVLVVGRNADVLAEAVGEHENMAFIAADLRAVDQAAGVVAAALVRWGRLDTLVNNAGIFVARPLAEVTAPQMNDLFTTHVVAPTLMLQAALPYLQASHGAVVNVSSTIGHKPSAHAAHYGASKAALEHLTRCWALELAPHRIRVNAIAPGPTDTPILERAGLSQAVVAATQRLETELIPLRRRGTPEEIAAWIVALTDPLAAWVTGQIISVDGGLSVT